MSHSNAYVEAFLTKKPNYGISIVRQRQQNANILEMELADYFKERARIEQEYSKSLIKASKKLYTMDTTVLGHFAPVWELLLKEFNQVATFHSEIAYQINHEIEKSLYSNPTQEDYHKLEQMEPLIQAIENKSKNKLASVKGSFLKKSTSKPKPKWENEGVQYLDLSQKIDELRLNRLKTAVIKFEKLQSTQLKKRIEMSDKSSHAAEVFEVQHDIDDFCSESGKGLETISKEKLQRISTMHDSQHVTTPSTKFKSVFTRRNKNGQEGYQPSIGDHINDESLAPETSPAPVLQESPKVDNEGYSVPPTSTQSPFTSSSNFSSLNVSEDDIDSDLQSTKVNQKLRIDIKDSLVITEEDTVANESFDKMATMLRERTPTITRKARGRRENSFIRSQSDLFNNGNALNDDINSSSHLNSGVRTNSITSFRTSSTNPFLQLSSANLGNSEIATSPGSLNRKSGKLQSINEDQKKNVPELNITIHENVKIIDKGNEKCHVTGKILISCKGTSNEPIKVQFSPTNRIQQLTPNPLYITTVSKYTYFINTLAIPQEEPTNCFTYESDLSDEKKYNTVPITLSTSWKCVKGTSFLIIKYKSNLPINQNVKGYIQVPCNQVSTAQSTPQALWDYNEKTLTWNLQDLLHQLEQQSTGKQTRLLAKFLLNDENQIGEPQPIFLNCFTENMLVSDLNIVFPETQMVKAKVKTSMQLERVIMS